MGGFTKDLPPGLRKYLQLSLRRAETVHLEYSVTISTAIPAPRRPPRAPPRMFRVAKP